MNGFKTLKGQVLGIAALCLVLALAVWTVANYLASRSQAYAALAAQSEILARIDAAALRDWVRTKTGIVGVVATVWSSPEPEPILKRLNDAGGFIDAYFGFPDKRTAFSTPQQLPPPGL